jgi:hypothetical protein
MLHLSSHQMSTEGFVCLFTYEMKMLTYLKMAGKLNFEFLNRIWIKFGLKWKVESAKSQSTDDVKQLGEVIHAIATKELPQKFYLLLIDGCKVI